MKAADHAGSLKRMRQNLRIGHILQNRPVAHVENKPPLGIRVMHFDGPTVTSRQHIS